ncbi:MAG: helix-turn-helix domain-containing protein [Nitrospirota bacterium]
MRAAILRLSKLGFSEYEAKAYITLLKENPLTAYEIAKYSGIPTSKIYEVIKKLENKHTIQSIHGERSKMYVPLSPEEFIQEFRSTIEDNILAVKEELKDIKAGMDTSYTWHIRKYDGLIHKAKRMIDTTRSSILLSVWPPEIKLLEKSLYSAEARGVRMAIVHYGAANIKIKQLYIHPIEDTVYIEKGVRGFTIVADSKEAMNGLIVSNKAEAIWSMNEGFLIMADGYIRHDIYQMKTMKRLSPLLTKIFGERYEMMRDVYKDENL